MDLGNPKLRVGIEKRENPLLFIEHLTIKINHNLGLSGVQFSLQ